METLDDFEKALASEKAARERLAEKREERRDRKHRQHRRHEKSSDRDHIRDDERERSVEGEKHQKEHERRRHRRHEGDEDSHRHKRSRHSRDDEETSKHRQRHDSQLRQRSSRKDDGSIECSDSKERPPRDEEKRRPAEEAEASTSLARDAWMTAPSALDIDYVHRASKKSSLPVAEVPKRVAHVKELNMRFDVSENVADNADCESRQVKYEFGDRGSQWRMTKLKGVYTMAQQTGRPVDEVALERFGSLKEFDDAREEEMEMDRRHVYGEGVVRKERPTGELYKKRLAQMTEDAPSDTRRELPSGHVPRQGVIVEDTHTTPPVLDRTSLNRLYARLTKAKLQKSSDVEKLENEYKAALAAFESGGPSPDAAVVLDASHNRMLAGARGEVKPVNTTRGRERGLVQANEDMSIEDMVQEERRTRGQAGGEGLRLAEQIARDGKFDDDLEYLDENAEKLAKRIHKSGANLKNMAVAEYKKMNRILDTCALCHHEDRRPPQDQPTAPIISLGTRVFLTLATEPELTGAEGGAVIVPISHHTNLLECDDDEWEEMRNFMKSLTRLYHDQGREVLFYENAAAPQRRLHAALVAVPIPYEHGNTAPAFFREAMTSTDEEWSQHKKIIDTGRRAREDGLGRLAFRRSLAREMPYFHVWFSLDGGLGHVVEDADRWPRGDLFAREVIGGMLDCEPDVIKKQGRWSRSDARVEGFRSRWRKFDWTRILRDVQ